MSGEDLDDNLDKDYQANPALDHYEAQGIDEQQYDMMDPQDRRAVDRELDEEARERMRQADRRGRVPDAMMMDDDSEMHDEDAMARRLRQERVGARVEDDHLDDDRFIDMEEQKGELKDWLKEPKTITFIRNAFNKFLRHFRESEEKDTELYEERINEMCHNNKQSLEVTYNHLTSKMPTLAIWIAEAPAEVFPILNQVAHDLVLEIYPNYENVHSKVFVRIKDLPIVDNLRDL